MMRISNLALSSLFLMSILNSISAMDAGTTSLGFRRNLSRSDSRSPRNILLRTDSDSEGTFPLDRPQLRQRSTSPSPEQYPSPLAKESKWRFDIRFSLEADNVVPRTLPNHRTWM
mmetsp:Transcript_27623/g.57440  ORF Transcript_27623/g.57440 Transcript_27623/m.57440 type:complete len:115 (-) Transcript_27623:437-781(-)